MDFSIDASALKRLLSVVLSISLLFSIAACGKHPDTSSSNSGQQIITEEHIDEVVISESVLTEFITSEIYLKEIIIAEQKISELLLTEQTISEVMLCKTIYVPQDNIGEFSEKSLTASLFGDDVDISPLLTKVAVGTGVIITVVILNMVGLPEPVASVVAAAADESLKFASSGAAIGSLFGGLTAATDEIDETGRTSSIVAFATATAGLILTTVSLIAAVPSAGSTTITAAAGIKLVIAGISMLAASAGTVHCGYQAVKTFRSTEAADIDWENINWKKVGVSAAQKSIRGAADGYMWGAIIGTVHGGAEGFDFYQKFNTPYTHYNTRLMQTPKNGSGGRWSGNRGESDFILDEPVVLSDGTKINRVTYKNAVPDFSPYQKAQVKISRMTGKRYGAGGNFEQADTALADFWTRIQYRGRSWTAREIEMFRTDNNLTWHEMSNMESMQLIPRDINQRFTHFGGVAEYKAMIGQEGAEGFD